MSEDDRGRYERAIYSAISFAEEHKPYLGGTPGPENLQPHRDWAEAMLYQFCGPKKEEVKRDGSV